MTRIFHDVDHLMCGCVDIGRAGETFARMGFTVGPVTRSGRTGCRNRRILFAPPFPGSANYLELIQFDGPQRDVLPLLQNFLGETAHGREEVSALIMSTHAPEAAHAHFSALHRADPSAGYEPDSLLVIDYVGQGPRGEPLPIGFTNCTLSKLRPPFWVSLCQIRSWDFYVHPDWTRHDNGVRSMVEVIVAAADPAGVASRYTGLWDAPARPLPDGALSFGPGDVTISIATPQGVEATFGARPLPPARQARIAGYVLTVSDLGRVEGILTRNAVPHRRHRGMVTVAPQDAHGHLIVFADEARARAAHRA